MANKNFNSIDTGRVYESIEKATAKGRKQKTASPEEIEQRQQEGRTRGRKGCYRDSFTIALTPQNHEYLKIMAKMTGQSAGEFLDYLLQAHKRANAEAVAQLMELNERIKANEWQLVEATFYKQEGGKDGKKSKRTSKPKNTGMGEAVHPEDG